VTSDHHDDDDAVKHVTFLIHTYYA